MIEDIFLTYANASLRENPDNLFQILKTTEMLFPKYDRSDLRLLVQTIVECAKYNERGVTEKVMHGNLGAVPRSLDTEEGRSWLQKSWANRIAIEAVYGYGEIERFDGEEFFSDDYCTESCSERRKRQRVFGKELFNGPKRLRCYECDQLFFISILNEIIKGKEFSKIKGFNLLMDSANHSENKTIIVDSCSKNTKTPFQEELKEVSVLFPTNIFEFLKDDTLDGWDPRNAFGNFLYSVFGYSLVQFLLKNDRRKLKKCEQCNRFYVSKSIRPSKFCSDRYRLAWHNRKRIASGEAKDYKRRKRKEGARESYYG